MVMDLQFFGGRGASSGLYKSKTQSLEEYLWERRLSAPMSDYLIDKLRIPHGLTERQRKKFEKDADKARNEYFNKREAAIKEYNEKVKSGEILKPGKYDKLLKTARGHSDNPSVQAARRALAKRGIDWKTGRKK